MLASLILLWLLADGNQARTLLQRGLVELNHGQLAAARADLEEATHIEPKNPYVWASLAQTYLRLNQPEKASMAAKTAEREGTGNPVVAHALALYYSEAGDVAQAAQWEEQYRAAAWGSAKTDPQVAFQYVQILLQRQQFTRAAEVSSTVLESHADDAQLTLALGVARYGQRRFEDSVVEFLKVIRIDPSIEQPYIFVGKMLDQAGTHLTEITNAYQGWAAANPNNATAQLLLAKALLAQDHHSEEAEQLLQRSIKLDPSKWESHYELGVLLEDKREYQAAAAELTRSIELDPKQAMPHYHLARVYDRLGQPEQAGAERELHRKLTSSSTAP